MHVCLQLYVFHWAHWPTASPSSWPNMRVSAGDSRLAVTISRHRAHSYSCTDERW